LGVEGPTIVAMIDRLMNGGLVLRVPSPTDRRVKLIALTDAGLALYGKVKAEADVFRSSLLSDVEAAELRAATELLERLRERLEAIL
jgi:MarR family transcriptional regulator for hemolysin